jgi:hypothetical protein
LHLPETQTNKSRTGDYPDIPRASQEWTADVVHRMNLTSLVSDQLRNVLYTLSRMTNGSR